MKPKDVNRLILVTKFRSFNLNTNIVFSNDDSIARYKRLYDTYTYGMTENRFHIVAGQLYYFSDCHSVIFGVFLCIIINTHT